MALTTAQIQQAYVTFFSRPADVAGLNYWSSYTGSEADLYATFAQSAEYTAAFANLSNGAKVNLVYTNLFGRSADVAGLNYWTLALDRGDVTVANLALALTAGAQGTDVDTVANRVSAATAFTSALDTSAEILGYSGATANAAAKAWLAGVTTADSLATATAEAALATNVASVVSTGGGAAAAGQTFTLTAGADTPATTSGNDTINALTINAAGAAAETFSAFDSIDGGAGNDTLNIYTTDTENEAFPASGSVKNVEIVNVFNSAAAAALADASKFEGVTQLWQHVAAADVTNLAATTTAGFKGVEATVTADLDVTAATAATTVAIALDGVKGAAATGGGETINRADIDVAGAALTGVTVTGTLAQKTTTAGSAAATLALNVTLAKDAQAGTVNSAVATILTIENDGASTKDLTSVDASASAAAITYAGADADVATIKTGAGNDTVIIVTATLKDDTTTTSVDETVSAVVDSGAGNDGITINTSGTGTTTVNAGEGNDTVTFTADGSGKLTVNLGAGNDTFKGAGAVTGTDVIDAGEGTDTLVLNMVGSANIAAFTAFETFDAAALAKTLDVDILATKNTVTEFVASADVGASAVLTNVGAGVGYRVTGDTDVTKALTLTQKTAGALTVTLDIDEAATTVAAFDSGAKTNVDAAVIASNATSLKAVFDSAFKDAVIAGDASDNLTNLTLTGTKATSLEVVSGGAFAINDLVYTSGNDTTAGKGDLLTSVTISGDRAITVAIAEADASEVTSINASTLTAALTISTAELKGESAANTFNGGTLTLGSGADVVTITQGASIAGLGFGTVEDATAQGAFDVLSTGGAVAQAADVAATASLTIKDGLFTFNGTGPATLAAAIAAVDAQLTVDNTAVVFEYIGNSYVFVGNDATADLVVKLTGVTGLKGLDEVGTSDTLYVF